MRISFTQFVIESNLREAATTLQYPYADWGYLKQLPKGEKAQAQNAWVDSIGSVADERWLEQNKAAYEARKKYPNEHVVHPVEPGTKDAAFNNDEDMFGVSDEWVARENKKYEDMADKLKVGVPNRSNAISGRSLGLSDHSTLAKKIGHEGSEDALKKGLIQYTIGKGGSVAAFTAHEHPKNYHTIVSYLQANSSIKGSVFLSLLGNDGKYKKVEFPDRQRAIQALKGEPTADAPTMTIKGQEYHIVGQQTDKKHAGWVHYVLKGKDDKFWGVSKSEDGKESGLIELEEQDDVTNGEIAYDENLAARGSVPGETAHDPWSDGWA